MDERRASARFGHHNSMIDVAVAVVVAGVGAVAGVGQVRSIAG
ncbi:hypothetical protein [Micromonospora zamorensis]